MAFNFSISLFQFSNDSRAIVDKTNKQMHIERQPRDKRQNLVNCNTHCGKTLANLLPLIRLSSNVQQKEYIIQESKSNFDLANIQCHIQYQTVIQSIDKVKRCSQQWANLNLL